MNKGYPILRDKVTVDLQSLFNRLLYYDEYPFKNCLNCTNFNLKTEICKLANQRPPAKVIVYGCPSHDDVGVIPF